VGLEVSSLFYLLIGAAVALAIHGSSRPARRWEALFRAATALLFWPLYLPLLLSRLPAPAPPSPDDRPPEDGLGEAIARVEAELEAALGSLDGWAEDVLLRERGRIEELKRSWKAQAARVREIDGLLEREERAGAETSGLAEEAAEGDPPETALRRKRCEEGRRRNLERLRQVRGRTYRDLMGTLAWVRELVSRVHLAKFTGAPASRAEDLVAQIAAAVDGFSAVRGWEEEEKEQTRSGQGAPEAASGPIRRS
jgi:hypothetical protein